MNMVITPHQLVMWVMKRRRKAKFKAFQGFSKILIESLITGLLTRRTKNIKLIVAVQDDIITGILIAKVFWDENRVHISQIIADNSWAFQYLLNGLPKNLDMDDPTYTYERRQKAIVLKNPQRFQHLVTKLYKR